MSSMRTTTYARAKVRFCINSNLLQDPRRNPGPRPDLNKYALLQQGCVLGLNRLFPIGRCVMTQTPHIRCECRYLVGRKLRATHRRHMAAILFWLRYTFGDRFLDYRIAAIAPQPFLAR